MKRMAQLRLILLLLACSTGFSAVRLLRARSVDPEQADATGVNLALRRTAHRLLEAAGDSTSRVPAVEHPSEQLWSVRLDHAFDYDLLPAILQESLEQQGIRNPYNLAVLGCLDGTLELGYTSIDYEKNQDVACGGRDIAAGCYILELSLLPAHTTAAAPWWPYLVIGLSVVLSGVLLLRWRRLPGYHLPDIADDAPADMLLLGQSRFSMTALSLQSGDTRHRLTYREAKLLQLLATHPNQVLERSFILEKVWGEEGILVGRSLDVFISRLRKLLRDDPAVHIVTVHGLGYKLEM
jgi:hypothetical protein